MRRRDYVLLLSVLRELVCLGCIVLLIESKVAAQEEVAESAASEARPTWVDKAPYEDGDTYVWPVASGARNTYYSSAADAESMLRQAAVAAVKNFIEVRLIREEEAGEALSRNNELRKLTLKKILDPERYVETSGSSGYRVHGVLRITPQVCREIERRWQEHPSNPQSRIPARSLSMSSARSADGNMHVQVDTSLAWSPIILLGVGVFVGWLIMNRHAQTSFVKFARFGLVFTIILIVGWMFMAGSTIEHRSPAHIHTHTNAYPTVGPVATSTPMATLTTTYGEKPAMEAESDSHVDSIPVDTAESAARPAWTNDSPHTSGDAYYIVVRSKVSDPKFREEALDLKMEAAAKQYLDDVLPGASRTLDLPAELLHSKCLVQRHDVPDTGESYVQLKFNQRFVADIKNRYRQSLSTARVEKLGGATLGVLGVMAAALAYLRYTTARSV